MTEFIIEKIQVKVKNYSIQKLGERFFFTKLSASIGKLVFGKIILILQNSFIVNNVFKQILKNLYEMCRISDKLHYLILYEFGVERGFSPQIIFTYLQGRKAKG